MITQELASLEQFFSIFPELKETAPLFLQNQLTTQVLKNTVNTLDDLEKIAQKLKLNLDQKLQLQALLVPSASSKETTQAKPNDTQSENIPEKPVSETSTENKDNGQDPPQKVKKTKLPKVHINTTRSRGELRLLKAIIEKNKAHGWKEVFGFNGEVMWSGLDIPWEDAHIATEIRLNRIPGMKMLAHKKITGYYLNKFREYYPDDFDFYPRTFLIPEEIDELKDHIAENPGRLYIAKPTSGSQGDGITLIRKVGELPQTNSSEMVVQEYIDKPLLLEGKKFDLRLYVLISNVKPMIAFLNEEGLARFCTEDYQPPTKENLKNCYMHLTNYSLNKLSANYVYTEECEEINNGSKRSFTSLWKSFEKAGYSRAEIMDNIKELIKKLLAALQSVIQFNYNVAFGGKDTGKCFHVLGIDVLIDENLKPWLLEINANPSLNIGHEDQSDPKLKEIVSPIDKYVKEKVIEDALLITRKSVAKQAEIETYRTYENIYNSEAGDFANYELFRDILLIFGKLSGVRFKTHLTSLKFIKLAAIPGMIADNLVKASYDIIYQKAIRGSDEGQMDFSTFIKAIEMITKLLRKEEFCQENKKALVENIVQMIKARL